MKLLVITLLFCLAGLAVAAQETEIFAATECGNPFSASSDGSDAGLFWNYSFGIERYIADKLTVAVSYRKMFDLGGSEDDGYSSGNSNLSGYNYSYTQQISSFAIDFESKYFFDAPDEGWYISSGLSYQHITYNIVVSDISAGYGYYSLGTPPPSTSSDDLSIFPVSIKMGHRNSSDTFVFDYFFGIAYNMGIGNVVHQYDAYFDYYPLKRVSYIFGIKVGVKI